MSKYITRPELSTLAELSEDSLRRNEDQLGLTPCKVKINARMIRYRRVCAITALRERGFSV